MYTPLNRIFHGLKQHIMISIYKYMDTKMVSIRLSSQVIPDVIDSPPQYPLDLTYKTIRTFPGMRLTADMTRSETIEAYINKTQTQNTVLRQSVFVFSLL